MVGRLSRSLENVSYEITISCHKCTLFRLSADFDGDQRNST